MEECVVCIFMKSYLDHSTDRSSTHLGKHSCLHTSKECKVPEEETFITPTAVTSNLAYLFHAYLYWLNLIVFHFSGLENYQSVDLLQDLIKNLYCCSEMKKLQRKPHFKYLHLFYKNVYSSTLNY